MPRILDYLFSEPDIALKTYVIVPLEEMSAVSEHLVENGLFEPAPPGETKKEIEKIFNLANLIDKGKKIFESLNSMIDQPVVLRIEDYPRDLEERLQVLISRLQEVYETVSSLINRAREIRDEAQVHRALLLVARDLSSKYPGSTLELLDYRGSYITTSTLITSKEEVSKIKSAALKIIAERDVDEKRVLLVGVFDTRVYEAEIGPRYTKLEILERYGQHITISSLVEELEKDIACREEEATLMENKAKELVNNNTRDLALLKVAIDAAEGTISLLKAGVESKYLGLMIGWVPGSKRKILEGVVSKYKGYVVYEEGAEPPVDFNNPEPIKPFELFTELIGYPSPRERDPTPFLTYMFLIFFSLMFPDIGYAIGLVIGSRLVLPFFVENKETIRRLIRIADTAAIVAVITGLLSGSFFGSLLGEYVQRVFPPVLPGLPPRLSDIKAVGVAIMDYIKLSLIVGYFVVILAHVIGLVKSIYFKNTQGALMEVSILGIAVIAPSVLSTYLPINLEIIPVSSMITPRILTYFVMFLLIMYVGLKVKQDGPLGGMLWVFDILGVMADVLSFVRIAGIAIGSALMAELINSLAHYVAGFMTAFNLFVGIIVGSSLALFLHVFNLGLSALGPFVHSLRLIMYEISSKFYEASGRRINPVEVVYWVKLGKR